VACPYRRGRTGPAIRGRCPRLRACVKLMRLTDGRSSPTRTWRRVAEGNCVAARRGGEQPEANLSSQTGLPRPVNPIRPDHVASLRSSGEARSLDLIPEDSQHVESWGYVPGAWGGKAGKPSAKHREPLVCDGEAGGSQSPHSSEEAVMTVERRGQEGEGEGKDDGPERHPPVEQPRQWRRNGLG